MRTLWIAAAMVAGLGLATPADAQRVWRNGQWTSLPPRTGTPPVAPPAPVVQGGGMVGGAGWSHPAPPPPQTQPPRNWQRPPGGTPPVWHNSRPGGPPPVWQNRTPGSRWGVTVNGRWHGGANAPGGWNAYRRPVRGWTMPNYWIAPSFYIQDYGVWGLSVPPQGYYWSRYYDDAVLIDDRGQVHDSVQGIDWEGGSYIYQDGADYPPPPQNYSYQTYSGGSVPPAGYAPPAAQACAVAYCGGAAVTYGYGYGYVIVPTTTTVVVQSAPVVTTTTVVEEVIEEEVVTRRVAPRRAARRPAPRPRAPTPRCVPCACVCR